MGITILVIVKSLKMNTVNLLSRVSKLEIIQLRFYYFFYRLTYKERQ